MYARGNYCTLVVDSDKKRELFENSYIKVKNSGNVVENNSYTTQFSNRFESRLCQSESPRLNSLPIKLRSEYNAANFYNRPSLLPNKSSSCNCRAQWLNMSIIRVFPSCLLKNVSFANVARAFVQIDFVSKSLSSSDIY